MPKKHACTAAALCALAALATPRPAHGEEQAFNYFSNPWSTVGLKAYADGTRLSPQGELAFADGSRVAVLAGEPLRPVRITAPTLESGWLPIVQFGGEAPGQPRFGVWATPRPEVPEWRRAFDGPRYGEQYVTWLSVQSGEPVPWGLQWNGPGGIRVEPAAGGAVLRAADGNVVAHLVAATGPEEGTADDLAQGLVRCTRPATVLFPFPRSAPGDPARSPLPEADEGLWRLRVREYWSDLLARGAEVSVPDEKALNTYRASLVQAWIGNDGTVVKAGEGFYDGLFLRDGAYQIHAYALAGYLREARPMIEEFLKYQSAAGQLVSQEGQLDGNGQGIWGVWAHWRLTGDDAWLRGVYPTMKRASEWLGRTRVKEPAPQGLFPGILPPSVADGEFLWAGDHQIVGYDVWNLRGVACTLDAARALGNTEDVVWLERLQADYREAVIAALDAAGRADFAASYQPGGTDWGDLELLYPTELFPPADPRVTRTLDRVRPTFREGVMPWRPETGETIHPYMSTFVTQDSLARGEQEHVVRDFYWYLLHTTSAHGFPEGVYDRTRTAWSDTLPHLWAAAEYIILLRNMLIREAGDELHLLGAVPPHWLQPGREVIFDRAPTTFGLAGLRVRATTAGLDIRVRPPDRRAPTRTVVHWPSTFHVESIRVDGRPLAGARFTAPGLVCDTAPRRIELQGHLGGDLGPTFASTVAECEGRRERVATPDFEPLPLPAEAGGEWVCIATRRQATTDPFAAPFMVPNAALFAGLPTGRTEVQGVPFELPDPPRNSGQGLVVLQGQQPCDTLPTSSSFRVRAAGRALWFLGFVTGWAPGDAGVGPLGEVARCVIVYRDGQEQSVPWVSGTTCDDWLQAPAATRASGVLQQGNWHLNVVGVPLREGAEVREVRFEDTGTPASPVLAALTLQR